MTVNARMLDRDGRFIDVIALKCMTVLVQYKGRTFVAIGRAWERANGTIDQDYAEEGVYCVSQSAKQ